MGMERKGNALVRVSEVVDKNRFLLPIYAAGVKLISKPEFNSFENNLDNLNIANEYLKNEGSLIIISNHRFPIQHQQTIVKIVEKLDKRNKEAVGIALTNRFRDDKNMNSVAKMVDSTLKSWKVEPIYFWREGIDLLEHKKANVESVKKVQQILKSKGGVFGFFPEGETGNELKEAKPGLWYFGKEAGLIMIVNTYLNENSSVKFKIKIEKPIEVKKIVKTINENMEKDKVSKIFMDYLMIKMAKNLPTNERGYYQQAVEMVTNLEEKNANQRWKEITEMWNKLESID